VQIQGNRIDENGGLMQPENVELWRRDPVDCIKSLLGNCALRDYLAYAPERVYADYAGKVRKYSQMWTADWWWDTQVSSLTHSHCLY